MLELPPLPRVLLMLVLQLSQHILIVLRQLAQLLSRVVHYTAEPLVADSALHHLDRTGRTKYMPALHLDRTLKSLSATLTDRRRLVFLYSLQQLLTVLLFSHIRVVDPLPPLSLLLLKILLQLPPSLMVRSIMQVETAVTKRTVPRIMPVLAQIKHIVKTTRIFNSRIYPRRTHLLLIRILRILYVMCCHFMVWICISTPVYLSVQLALLHQLCFLYIFQKPSLRRLLLQLVLFQIQILDHIDSSTVSSVIKGLLHLLLYLLLLAESAAPQHPSVFYRHITLFLPPLRLIIQLLPRIRLVQIFMIFSSLQKTGLTLPPSLVSNCFYCRFVRGRTRNGGML